MKAHKQSSATTREKAILLRTQAEQRLAAKAKAAGIPEGGVEKIVHELRVHQIELEMQNEELRSAQQALENSRARFSDLYDFSPAGYFTVDKKTRIVEANLTASRFLGFDRSYILGKPFNVFIDKEDRDIFYMHHRGLWKGHSKTCEIRLVKKGGAAFHAQLVSSLYAGTKDARDALIAVFDITERRRAEEELARKNSLVSNILEGISDGFLASDESVRVTYFNAAAQRLLGRRREDIIGRHLFNDAFPDARETIFEQRYMRALRERRQDFFEAFFESEPYRNWYEVKIYPYSEGLCVFFQVITDRKKHEQQLEDLNRQLLLSNRDLESLGHTLSHDLRAPLRTIGGFSKILLEEYGDKLDEEGAQYLRQIDNGSRRMNEIISSLLKVAQIARGEIRREMVDLSALAKEIARELTEAEPEREVVFTIQDNLFAVGDRQLLRIALENLIRNAWKFTGKRRHAAIAFGTTHHKGKACFFVRDNGAGFDMKNADRMFQIFQRLHSDADFRGMGVGLATVQRIINRYGGEIRAEGKVDKGATFYFSLPETIPDQQYPHGGAASP